MKNGFYQRKRSGGAANCQGGGLEFCRFAVGWNCRFRRGLEFCERPRVTPRAEPGARWKPAESPPGAPRELPGSPIGRRAAGSRHPGRRLTAPSLPSKITKIAKLAPGELARTDPRPRAAGA